MTILVFPSTLEASVSFAREAHRWGCRTIGASSVQDDPNAAAFDYWELLPFIGEASFLNALRDLATRYGVTRIYTPHAPTFHLLNHDLPMRAPELQLVGEGPFAIQMSGVQNRFAQATDGVTAVAEYGEGAPPFGASFLAGLLAKVEEIHGECSRDKILALCGVVPSAPQGDVVEIGCLYGKSSYVLNRLASHARVGATLCIDPWDLGLSIQHDAPMFIQRASEGWNWEIIFQGFLMNMLGCGAPPLNYLRSTSADAFSIYSAGQPVTSPEFGETLYSGAISVLHIDGNHDEAAVQHDFDLWSQRLVPGAWIIFDDYNWPHGNGPRQVADRALAQYAHRVRRCFVAGGAMFMNIDG